MKVSNISKEGKWDLKFSTKVKGEGVTKIKIIEYRNAGFFIYMDLSPYLPSPKEISNTNEREFALAKKFLDAGVFIHPGEEHGNLPGWFRLVYSHEEEVLQEGLRR